ncbi:MAG: hypothetical protein J6I55_08750 [Ruminococcus sp.]|nr:hypothetical protein [Ruminococcus sp.]
MRLDFFKKEKIIKYSILVILAVGLLSIVYKIRSIECYDYVDNLCYECNGISDLDNYIDYNMLSKSLKELIPKDNFVFSTTEEKYHFCNLIMNLDYNYNHNSNVYSTNQFRSDLAERITIDDKRYLISVTIVFKPRWFFKPKIVDLDACVADISITE